jgi:hypothetical protein
LEEKFYYYDGKILCDSHYFEAAGEICHSCHEPIRGELMIDALEKKWHPICKNKNK